MTVWKHFLKKCLKKIFPKCLTSLPSWEQSREEYTWLSSVMVNFQVVYCRWDELISNCTSAYFVPSSVLCTKDTKVSRPKSLIPWAYIREVMGDKLVNEYMNRRISDSGKGEDKLSCSDRGWEGEANGGKLRSDVLGVTWVLRPGWQNGSSRGLWSQNCPTEGPARAGLDVMCASDRGSQARWNEAWVELLVPSEVTGN